MKATYQRNHPPEKIPFEGLDNEGIGVSPHQHKDQGN